MLKNIIKLFSISLIAINFASAVTENRIDLSSIKGSGDKVGKYSPNDIMLVCKATSNLELPPNLEDMCIYIDNPNINDFINFARSKILVGVEADKRYIMYVIEKKIRNIKLAPIYLYRSWLPNFNSNPCTCTGSFSLITPELPPSLSLLESIVTLKIRTKICYCSNNCTENHGTYIVETDGNICPMYGTGSAFYLSGWRLSSYNINKMGIAYSWLNDDEKAKVLTYLSFSYFKNEGRKAPYRVSCYVNPEYIKNVVADGKKIKVKNNQINLEVGDKITFETNKGNKIVLKILRKNTKFSNTDVDKVVEDLVKNPTFGFEVTYSKDEVPYVLESNLLTLGIPQEFADKINTKYAPLMFSNGIEFIVYNANSDYISDKLVNLPDVRIKYLKK